MKLIVGLGNPGKRYEGTPHNVGFDVVDVLARSWQCRLRRSLRFHAWVGRAATESGAVLLAQPATYMNRSGRAVAAIMRYWKLTPGDLVLVMDDADLELGCLRVRAKGSSGGHRGLASVIDGVGASDFVRVRLGIGRGRQQEELVSHVLAKFGRAERELADQLVQSAADAVCCVLSDGVATAMNRFNGRIGPEKDASG